MGGKARGAGDFGLLCTSRGGQPRAPVGLASHSDTLGFPWCWLVACRNRPFLGLNGSDTEGRWRLKDGRLDALSSVKLLSGWEAPWPSAPRPRAAGLAPPCALLCFLPRPTPSGRMVPTAPPAGTRDKCQPHMSGVKAER